MKAIVYTNYGPPDVLELKDVEKPVPGDNEVLVKIYAGSINDWDWGFLIGKPFANRVINGLIKPKLKILGCDIAGQVESVGKNVKRFKPGDNVYGDMSECGFGGFAEYVCAKEKALALKPESMSYEDAAAIPQAGMLAVQGLLDIGEIKSKKKILINGAGGGVGTIGIQIAKLFGVKSTGVDSTEKLEMMSSLGFDHVIDYTKEDFTKGKEHYDLILDNKITRSVFSYMRVLNPNGIYVTTGGLMTQLFFALIMSPLVSLFSNKRIRFVGLKPNKDLVYLNKLFEEGKLKPVLDSPYKLADLPEALRYFGEGKHKGKIIFTV